MSGLNSTQESSISKVSQSKQEKPKNNELQQIIIANQNFSQKYKGFYKITEWRKLNELLFSPTQFQQKTTVSNCWRLMKLINFGDDIIPTGLIFDCVMTLMNVDQTVQQTQQLLKAIFIKFIQINGKYLTQKQRQELAFFKVIRIVVQGYRKIIADKLDTQNTEQNDDGKPHDRNQQLYLLHDAMTYKKDLQRLKKIQNQFKECSFEPKINQYSAEIGESRYMNSSNKRIQNSIQQKESKYVVIDERQQYGSEERFKARPLPNYPQYEPPREYFQHLERMKKSRKINSINSQSLKSISADVKQFSIEERNQLRKKNLLENFRILFMIKVQIGKRIYRVKVRQNMGVNETVNAIEKMVGFRNSQIVDIVKSYFNNWQRREKIKHQLNHQQKNSDDGF